MFGLYIVIHTQNTKLHILIRLIIGKIQETTSYHGIGPIFLNLTQHILWSLVQNTIYEKISFEHLTYDKLSLFVSKKIYVEDVVKYSVRPVFN